MRKLIGLAIVLMGCGGQIGDDATDSTAEALNGDTWTTIVNSTGAGFGANYTAAATKNDQSILIGGYRWLTAATDTSACVVRRTTDGATFANDEIYTYPGGNSECTVRGLVADGSGHTFSMDSIVVDHGTPVTILSTRKSVSGNGGYVDNDTTTVPSDQQLYVVQALYRNGYVYRAATYAPKGTGAAGTLHLRFSNGGAWSEIGGPANVTVLTSCVTSLGVTVAGVANGTVPHWVVYATTDNATWHQYDSWDPPPGATARAAVCTQVGSSIYVAGLYHDTSWSWVDRKGTSSGTGWAVDETVASANGFGPNAIGPGSGGRVYLLGPLGASNGTYRWHAVRRDTSGGWLDSDDYNPGRYSDAYGYTYSTTLGAFAVGSSGTGNAIVRHLPN